jgi:hypothetical protein
MTGFTLNDLQATILQETMDFRLRAFTPEAYAAWLANQDAQAFRGEVRGVLLSSAALPMVCLGILEGWTDEALEAQRVKFGGDAVEVALVIANESVEDTCHDRAMR